MDACVGIATSAEWLKLSDPCHRQTEARIMLTSDVSIVAMRNSRERVGGMGHFLSVFNIDLVKDAVIY